MTTEQELLDKTRERVVETAKGIVRCVGDMAYDTHLWLIQRRTLGLSLTNSLTSLTNYSHRRQETIEKIGSELESSLKNVKETYEKAKIFEQKYYNSSGESDKLIRAFAEEHGKLCYWLASQKPWGERQ